MDPIENSEPKKKGKKVKKPKRNAISPAPPDPEALELTVVSPNQEPPKEKVIFSNKIIQRFTKVIA
jgi:hypothetical protein